MCRAGRTTVRFPATLNRSRSRVSNENCRALKLATGGSGWVFCLRTRSSRSKAHRQRWGRTRPIWTVYPFRFAFMVRSAHRCIGPASRASMKPSPIKAIAPKPISKLLPRWARARRSIRSHRPGRGGGEGLSPDPPGRGSSWVPRGVFFSTIPDHLKRAIPEWGLHPLVFRRSHRTKAAGEGDGRLTRFSSKGRRSDPAGSPDGVKGGPQLEGEPGDLVGWLRRLWPLAGRRPWFPSQKWIAEIPWSTSPHPKEGA